MYCRHLLQKIALGTLFIASSGVFAGINEAAAAYSEKRYSAALAELKPLADLGNARALYLLSEMHSYGKGVPENKHEGTRLLTLAAERNDSSAQYDLAKRYEWGHEEAPKDYQRALHWYRLAAENGNSDALWAMGSVYENGKGVPVDYREAMKWYSRAADGGHPGGFFMIGQFYEKGLGVSKNIDTAVEWYRQAAARKHWLAIATLAVMYEEGNGVTQDYKEAFKWYLLGAQDSAAIDEKFAVAKMYAEGRGTRQDFKEAIRWYREVAAWGNGPGRNNLGLMYEYGQGTKPNRVVAYALYNLAASDVDVAKANRSRIMRTMTPREIEAGQDLSRALTQKARQFLELLDNYVKNPAIKEGPQPLSSLNNNRAPQIRSAPISDPYPVRPEKRAGVVSCNTNCVNANCWRTYDDGRKIQFQARRVYDAISGDWKYDSGSC